MSKRKISLLPSANEVWGKVIFSQTCVIPSVLREGGLHPREGVHPGGLHSGSDTVNERAVRILLECILVPFCGNLSRYHYRMASIV